jgi:hypothetical protein
MDIESGIAVPDEFQVPLYSATGLQDGQHTVVITNKVVNSSFPWLDIDFVSGKPAQAP